MIYLKNHQVAMKEKQNHVVFAVLVYENMWH